MASVELNNQIPPSGATSIPRVGPKSLVRDISISISVVGSKRNKLALGKLLLTAQKIPLLSTAPLK